RRSRQILGDGDGLKLLHARGSRRLVDVDPRYRLVLVKNQAFARADKAPPAIKPALGRAILNRLAQVEIAAGALRGELPLAGRLLAVEGVIGRPQVPLAKAAGGIAGLLEQRGDGHSP